MHKATGKSLITSKLKASGAALHPQGLQGTLVQIADSENHYLVAQVVL